MPDEPAGGLDARIRFERTVRVVESRDGGCGERREIAALAHDLLHISLASEWCG
jgi:hypothetical protein